jgi:hypothetical protein
VKNGGYVTWINREKALPLTGVTFLSCSHPSGGGAEAANPIDSRAFHRGGADLIATPHRIPAPQGTLLGTRGLDFVFFAYFLMAPRFRH